MHSSSALRSRRLLLRCAPTQVRERPATASGARASAHWALITLGFLVFSFFVANAIPFFADFQDLLGNLLGAPTVFGWPALFFLRGMRLRGAPVSWRDTIICALFLGICLPAFTLLGTVNALIKIG